jgi:hypothetical protein
MLKGVNWIAVIVAVVLLEVLGMLWYGPLFGQAWMASHPDLPTAADTTKMAIGAVNSLILVVGLSWLTNRLDARSLAAAVGVSVAAWFFFDFTTQALEYLYMGMSTTFVGINMGFQFVSYVLTGAVLALVKFGRKA